MRIWSIHPKYLDSKGLVACWRESLLAKHVLEGKTRGYKNHSQLTRFKSFSDSLKAINFYLSTLFLEAEHRGFSFSEEKFEKVSLNESIFLNKNQLLFELNHLEKKILRRSPSELGFSLKNLKNEDLEELRCFVHPLFVLKEGPIEDWEKV